MSGLIKKILGGFDHVATTHIPSVASLVMRLVIARQFLKSGMEKAKNMENAADLFQYDWFSDENWWMQLFGFEEIPRILAVLLAWAAAAGELILPVLLIIGLFTRLAGAGLLAMVLVISLLVYPIWTASGHGFLWTEFAWWISGLLVIIGFGGQKFSIDHLRGSGK